MNEVLISNATILTMDASRKIIPNGWLRIHGDTIVEIGYETRPTSRSTGAVYIDAAGALVTPGLISVHNHVIDSLLRGGVESDRGLFDWLMNVYYTGTSFYEPADCAIAARLTTAEAMRAGVTTIVDNWGVNNGGDRKRIDACADATIEVYREVGIRTIFARMYSDTFPAYWADLVGSLITKRGDSRLSVETLVETTEGALESIEALMRKYHGVDNGRISVCPSPILPQTNTIEGMRQAKELASRFDTVFPIHLCESELDSRVFPSSGSGGMSAVEFLNNAGLLDSRTLAAHCVWLDHKDMRLLKVNDVKVAHCPTSNMFLGAGIARIEEMLARGITVGLGTDDTNASSNASILKDMRHAVLLAKVASCDAGAITAERVLEMATIDGAKALGLDSQIGSIEVGKKGDLVIWNTEHSHWYPRHHWPSALVYQAHCSDPDTVLIDGRVIMHGRKLHHLSNTDEVEMLHEAQRASEGVLARAGMNAEREGAWQSVSLN